ncbi:baseplate J protein [Bacillaceae bacterium SAOS 7]|nr:baseplate J protein [Bacillaceae bacterium SAOS 7]
MARFNLPDIDFVDIDVADLEYAAVTKFEELQGVTLSEADPRRKFIQSVAFVAAMMANNIDYTGKQNLLSYAVDDNLDHKGAEKGVPRLEPQPAKTKIRFQVNNPEIFTIPAGTRFSVKDVFFATAEDKKVDIGLTFVDVEAVCLDPGTIGNDFLPGQITELVDPLPWVSSVANITTSSGGVDWEEDNAYAERIKDANESLATTGPEGAYEFFAKSANQDIIDVKTTSPLPCHINIYVLMKNGELPTQEVKDQVLAKCSARDVRPLTDKVAAEDPVLHEYDLNVSYYLPESSRATQSVSQAKIEDAVQKYKLWQKSKLGRGIDPSELYARMQKEGARRVLVEPNEYVELDDNVVARDRTINVTFGGFIND